MEKEKNYITGIVGGLIFGLLASLPWLLIYIYGSYLLSLLAFPIALGIHFGYRKFNGKVDNKLPMIIIILTLVIIAVLTLVIIPLCLLAKEGYFVDFDNLKLLYENEKFMSGIMRDLIISLVFAFLGAMGVVNKVKQELLKGDGNYENPKFFENNSPLMEQNKEVIKEIKAVFKKKNAFDKQNTITKDDLKEILNHPGKKGVFNTLRIQQIIRKYKGNYYFSEKAEKSAMHRFLLLYSKIMISLLLIAFIVVMIIVANK